MDGAGVDLCRLASMGRQEMEDATATLDAESASVQDRVKEALRILKEAAKNWNTLELIEVRTLSSTPSNVADSAMARYSSCWIVCLNDTLNTHSRRLLLTTLASRPNFSRLLCYTTGTLTQHRM
jgi:hypothetical protein